MYYLKKKKKIKYKIEILRIFLMKIVGRTLECKVIIFRVSKKKWVEIFN